MASSDLSSEIGLGTIVALLTQFLGGGSSETPETPEVPAG